VTPAPHPSTARRWLHRHPAVVDVAVAVVALVAALMAADTPSRLLLAANDAPTTVLCVLASLALLARRRWPWVVWAVTVGIGLVGVVVVGGPSRALVPTTVAVYTLSTRVHPRPAIAAALATALVPFTLVVTHTRLGVLEAFAYGFGPWSWLAAVTGMAVRYQREVLDAAHERARRAEETREEEARRAVSEERLRIARDLHDVVAHHIAVITVQAGVASHLLRSDPDGAATALAHVREAGQVVLEEVPGLLGVLRTPPHGSTGATRPADDLLETAPAPRLSDLETLVGRDRASGLAVTVRRSGAPVDLGAAGELTACRILQEGLTNAARHGEGPAVVVVAYDPTGCTVEVHNRRASRREHTDTGVRHGLTGMRERAATAGGELTVGPHGHDEWVVRYRGDARATGSPSTVSP